MWSTLRSFLPALAWYGMITWLSSQPSLPGPELYMLQVLWFKSAHIIVYGILAGFLWHGWASGTSMHPRWLPHATTLSVIALALVDELHQAFVPGRTPRPSDIMINLLGTGGMILLLTRYNQWVQAKKRRDVAQMA